MQLGKAVWQSRKDVALDSDQSKQQYNTNIVVSSENYQ